MNFCKNRYSSFVASSAVEVITLLPGISLGFVSDAETVAKEHKATINAKTTAIILSLAFIEKSPLIIYRGVIQNPPQIIVYYSTGNAVISPANRF